MPRFFAPRAPHIIRNLDSVQLTWVVNKMASTPHTAVWQVYKDLCQDAIKNQPEYMIRLIEVLEEQKPLKVVVLLT